MAIPRQPELELMDLPAEAEAYAKADFSAVNAAFVERALELAGDAAELHVVDLGTGPADIPIRLVRARPAWTIVAVDAAPAMLDLAKANIERAGVADRIKLVLADAKNAPLPAHSFDLVLSNSILHHVADPLAFWREVQRLGKPGSLLFLRDLFRPASVEDADRIVQTYAGAESKLLQQEFHRSLLAAYTLAEVREQLRKVDLERLEVVLSSDRHLDVFGRLD